MGHVAQTMPSHWEYILHIAVRIAVVLQFHLWEHSVQSRHHSHNEHVESNLYWVMAGQLLGSEASNHRMPIFELDPLDDGRTHVIKITV